jgi:kynureninase
MTPMTETEALALDAADELPTRRSEFHVPSDWAYLAGNSLGLQHRSVRPQLLDELDDWAQLGVEAHLEGRRPWLPYHEQLREPAARLVGAQTDEVVMMNSLTVNLHLMMVSFYRPSAGRNLIVIEDSTFPSDSYAVRSQAVFHGYDPDVVVVRLATDEVLDFLAAQGDRVALVMLGGVNYLTGELLDIPAITAAGHAAGAVVGWDLAHAAGNVPLQLHDWDVDWAAWCTYKYLNSGPGAVAGAFVHARHLTDRTLPRFEGWWGTQPATRFRMGPVLSPVDSADAWQLSNPPILAMSPVLASLEVFDAVGMSALRAKSRRLTAYLETQLDGLDVLTPPDPDRRGAQLSVRVADAAGVSKRLRAEFGVIADSREPDVIRLAPAPLYNTFHDCWRAGQAMQRV